MVPLGTPQRNPWGGTNIVNQHRSPPVGDPCPIPELPGPSRSDFKVSSSASRWLGGGGDEQSGGRATSHDLLALRSLLTVASRGSSLACCSCLCQCLAPGGMSCLPRFPGHFSAAFCWDGSFGGIVGRDWLMRYSLASPCGGKNWSPTSLKKDI